MKFSKTWLIGQYNARPRIIHNKALYLTRSDLGISNTSIAFSAVYAWFFMSFQIEKICISSLPFSIPSCIASSARICKARSWFHTKFTISKTSCWPIQEASPQGADDWIIGRMRKRPKNASAKCAAWLVDVDRYKNSVSVQIWATSFYQRFL